MPKKFKFFVYTSLIALMGCGGDSESNPVVPSLETQKLKNTPTNSTPLPALENKLCVAAFQLARDVCLADFRGRDRAVCMQEATAKKKACQAGEQIIEPNTFLTFIFDESDDLPLPKNLSVFVDGSAVSSFDDTGRLAIFLSPGTHDIQVISSTRSAARVSLEVEEDSQIERTIVLKSESLALIGDYEVVVLGTDDDGIINVDAPFAFGVTDPEGALLPFDDITLVRVVRIESGSFVEGVGGFEVGKRELVQNRFTAQGASATISDAAAFESVVRSLGIGEYEIEVALYDSVNDRVYGGVAFFRYGERIIWGTVDGPFDASALEIDLRSADGTIQKTAITDANGRFIFENLPVAVYQLSVVVDDGGSTVRSAAGLVRTILGNAGATVTPITLKERDEGASEIEIDEGDFVSNPPPLTLQKSGE